MVNTKHGPEDAAARALNAIFKGYDHEQYIENCKKMIQLNNKQLLRTEQELREARHNLSRNPRDRIAIQEKISHLEMEVEGWEKWIDRWKTWYAMAMEAHNARNTEGETDAPE